MNEAINRFLSCCSASRVIQPAGSTFAALSHSRVFVFCAEHVTAAYHCNCGVVATPDTCFGPENTRFEINAVLNHNQWLNKKMKKGREGGAKKKKMGKRKLGLLIVVTMSSISGAVESVKWQRSLGGKYSSFCPLQLAI